MVKTWLYLGLLPLKKTIFFQQRSRKGPNVVECKH